MRFSIRYRTEYRYDGPVHDQHNALRVKPAAAAPGQRLERFSIAVEPNAHLHAYTDYFGTEVVEWGVAERHELLAVEAEAVVTTEPPSAAAPPASLYEAAEFLIHAQDEPSNGALDPLRGAVRRDSQGDTLRAVCEAIPDRFDYRQGATYVGSTVDDLLAGGAGVCQDFVHLALILLRGENIPARYVSGYLYAAPENGGADSVEVNTHAWVEALVDGRWTGADPTNRTLAGERHVKIGHGRHYGDVPPIKGVYKGSASAAKLDVSVKMTRLDG